MEGLGAVVGGVYRPSAIKLCLNEPGWFTRIFLTPLCCFEQRTGGITRRLLAVVDDELGSSWFGFTSDK